MPKKRFSSQYSKPQSTVHPSLGSANNAALQKKDAVATVNELINSSRKSVKAKGIAVASPTPSLPPQIRHLLAQPETPALAPRTRGRRRFDANGRPLPAGPPPPRSWLEQSRHAPQWMKNRQDERPHPTDLYHLPGLQEENGRSLQSMCMRQMAMHWEYVREYEQNNLKELPSGLRMELLSHIAIGGPDDGIGLTGLRSIIASPGVLSRDSMLSGALHKLSVSGHRDHNTQPLERDAALDDEWDAEPPTTVDELTNNNASLFRLDLSGSLGHTVSFKQLSSLVERPGPSLPAPIPHLTHLSLSYPSSSVSWRSLLAFSKHIPTLTHLSLAYWPTPTLTPNARAAVMSSQFGKDVQYGATNFYSHSLDNDFREAADVLKRLASRLYALEYMDLTGCSTWTRALRWVEIDPDAASNNISPAERNSSFASRRLFHVEGIDWRISWLKLNTLKLNTEIALTEQSHFRVISAFANGVSEAKAIQKMLAWWMKKGGRKGTWIDVEFDNPEMYHDFWRGKSDEERINRTLLNTFNDTKAVDEEIIIMTSLFDQGGEIASTVEDTHLVDSRLD